MKTLTEATMEWNAEGGLLSHLWFMSETGTVRFRMHFPDCDFIHEKFMILDKTKPTKFKITIETLEGIDE